jgi:hypothetical protein
MIRKSVLFPALLLASMLSPPALAQDKPFFPIPLPFPNFEGTPEEQKACRPDVVRLCPQTVEGIANPDPQNILACLQANRARLKPACRAVLESHGV